MIPPHKDGRMKREKIAGTGVQFFPNGWSKENYAKGGLRQKLDLEGEPSTAGGASGELLQFIDEKVRQGALFTVTAFRSAFIIHWKYASFHSGMVIALKQHEIDSSSIQSPQKRSRTGCLQKKTNNSRRIQSPNHRR